MAQRTVVTLTDDLDGGEATTTLHFAVDAVEYEIDVSDKNAQKFQKALAPYIEAARRVSASSGRGSGSRRQSSRLASKRDSHEIRAWAQQHGYEVSARGRISREVADAYKASQ